MALPTEYFRYYRWWFYLGWPGFAGVLAVFYLMVVKPAICATGIVRHLSLSIGTKRYFLTANLTVSLARPQ